MPKRDPETPDGPLLEWAEEIVAKRYGTWGRFADAIGKTQGSLKRTLRSGYGKVETILMLAKATGTPPGELLNRVGKGDAHQLITELYGTERVPLRQEIQDVVRFLEVEDRNEADLQRYTIAVARSRLQPAPELPPTVAPVAASKAASRGRRGKRGTHHS